jgi:hypothetical protein
LLFGVEVSVELLQVIDLTLSRWLLGDAAHLQNLLWNFLHEELQQTLVLACIAE